MVKATALKPDGAETCQFDVHVTPMLPSQMST